MVKCELYSNLEWLVAIMKNEGLGEKNMFNANSGVKLNTLTEWLKSLPFCIQNCKL